MEGWDKYKVGQWLDQHSFSAYKAAFEQHGINGEILLELTYESLKDIGVQKVGDRARILQIIKKEFRTKVKGEVETSKTPSDSSHLYNSNSGELSGQTVYSKVSDMSSPNFSKKFTRSPALAEGNTWGSQSNLRSQGSGILSSQRSASFEHELDEQYISPTRTDSKGFSPAQIRKTPKGADSPYNKIASRKMSREIASSLVISPRSSSMRTGHDITSASPKQDSPVSPISQLISLGFIDENRKKEKVEESNETLYSRSKCIRVNGTRDQTFVIEIVDSSSPYKIREAIFERFGILDPHERKEYVLLAMDSAKSAVVKIDDDELMKVVNVPNHPYKANLTLRKQYIYPENERAKPSLKKLEISKSEPNLFSSEPHLVLRSDRSQTKLSKFFGEPNPPLSASPVTTPVSTTYQKPIEFMERANQRSTKSSAFFGERPPDAMIANQLEDFFPEIASIKSNSWSIAGDSQVTFDLKKLSLLSNNSTSSAMSSDHSISEKDEKPNHIKNAVQQVLLNRLSKVSNRRSSVFEIMGKRKMSVKSAQFTKVPAADESPVLETLKEDTLETQPEVNSVKVYKEVLQEAIKEERKSFAAHIRQSSATKTKTEIPAVSIPEVDEKIVKIHREPIKKWTQGQLIGQGAFGKVFHGLNLDTGEIMAIKQVIIGQANDSQKKKREDALRREMELFEEMDHQNIVRYLGYELTDTTFNVFLEYVPGGSIASCLIKFGKFEDDLARSMTCQILCGMEYLHEKSIIHRDIKAANILVDSDGVAKISDFGISKKNEYQTAYQRVTRMSMQGSIYWMAPEVAQGKGYSAKVDIWSLGCLVLEMLTGQQPWFGVKGNIIYLLGSGKHPPVPDRLSDIAKDFISKCFIIDPELRPTASQLLEHSFADVNPLEFDFRKWHEAALAKKAQEDAENSDSSSGSSYSSNDSESDAEPDSRFIDDLMQDLISDEEN